MAAILAGSFLFAQWFMPGFRAGGGVPIFYQEQFAPGVMLACGKGYGNLDLAAAPAVQAFLDMRVDRFSCGSLPASLTRADLDYFQRGHRYLIGAAGVIWRVAGIAWSTLDLLAGAFLAVTLAAAYGAMRFVCGRFGSALVTLAWSLSPLHLAMLPQLRDYSQAPFFVLMLVAVGVAFTERRPGRLIAVSAVFGAVQGLGFGMRTDVILNLGPFLVALFAAISGAFLSNLRVRLTSAAVAVATFLVVALPALRGYQSGHNLWHVALLGLTVPFDQQLNVKPALYDLGYVYRDGYVEATVSSYGKRIHPAAPSVALSSTGSLEYDAACREYYGELARVFPADMISRMVAASMHVFNMPFRIDPVRVGVSSPLLAWAVRQRLTVLSWFDGWGLLSFVGLLVLLGVERLRYTVLAFAMVFAWTAYTFIEFENRHIFHLEFVALGLAVWALALFWRTTRRVSSAEQARLIPVRAGRAASLAVALFLMPFCAVAIAHTIQEPRARSLLESYTSAAVDRLAANRFDLDGEHVRLSVNMFAPPRSPNGAEAAFVIADVGGDGCGSSPIDMTFRYEDVAPRLGLDFTRTMTVPPGSTAAPTKVFFPVYGLHRDGVMTSWFSGVDIRASAASCVSLWRMRDPNGSGHVVWLNATLPSDWMGLPLYQRINLTTALPTLLWRPILHWVPSMRSQ